RGKREFIPAMADRLADALFAETVRRGGINVRDPHVENAPQQPRDGPLVGERITLGVFGLLVPTDFERTESNRRDGEAGIAERAWRHDSMNKAGGRSLMAEKQLSRKDAKEVGPSTARTRIRARRDI